MAWRVIWNTTHSFGNQGGSSEARGSISSLFDCDCQRQHTVRRGIRPRHLSDPSMYMGSRVDPVDDDNCCLRLYPPFSRVIAGGGSAKLPSWVNMGALVSVSLRTSLASPLCWTDVGSGIGVAVSCGCQKAQKQERSPSATGGAKKMAKISPSVILGTKGGTREVIKLVVGGFLYWRSTRPVKLRPPDNRRPQRIKQRDNSSFSVILPPLPCKFPKFKIIT